VVQLVSRWLWPAETFQCVQSVWPIQPPETDIFAGLWPAQAVHQPLGGRPQGRAGFSASRPCSLRMLLCWSPEDHGSSSARASRHHTAGRSCRARWRHEVDKARLPQR